MPKVIIKISDPSAKMTIEVSSPPHPEDPKEILANTVRERRVDRARGGGYGSDGGSAAPAMVVVPSPKRSN